MATVVIVLGHGEIQEDYITLESTLIGVDAGAHHCAQKGLMMDVAIGDFDSVSPSEFEHIQIQSKQIILLDENKEDSDFEAALKLVDDYDKIIVFGNWGKRFDHTYVNLQLLKQDHRITFIDRQNKVYVVEEGNYSISKDNYQYLSLFALEESTVSLHQTKYELENRVLKINDVYTLSNEINGEAAKLVVHTGLILVIQSKD